jgi:hypothetical protein
MRILFLDDDDDRHNRFRGHVEPAHTVVSVHTVKEAIEALKGERFDQVWLDHDLDLTYIVDGVAIAPEETGKDVAHYISLHMERDKMPFVVVIHSVNPGGAREMEGILLDGGVIAFRRPFHTLFGR